MIVVIRFLAWLCRIASATAEPGYSREGPPCTLQMFAGVKPKPAWSTAVTARCAEVWTLFAKGQIR